MGLKLNATNGGGSVELDVPDTVNSDITFTLPGSDGTADQVLSTNASGVLSFAAPGRVLQIQQLTFTTAVSYAHASGTWQDITQLDLNITPTHSDSRILVELLLSYSCHNAGTGHLIGLDRIVGGTTTADIIRGTDGSTVDGWFGLDNNFDQSNFGNIVMNASGHFLDSPNTTNTITYQPKLWSATNSATITLNESDSDNLCGTCVMTLTEIAA